MMVPSQRYEEDDAPSVAVAMLCLFVLVSIMFCSTIAVQADDVKLIVGCITS